jgi:hypothetical protein
MVSKLVLGLLAAAGVSAGFALAGPPRSSVPTLGNALEVSQLYHNEVALTAQESHLQQLLGFARAELARPAVPAPAATPAPQAVLVASPASPPPSGPAVAPAPSHATAVSPPAAPAPTTTTTQPPPPPPLPTTTTTTTPRTTTTTPPTTTTTRPREDD